MTQTLWQPALWQRRGSGKREGKDMPNFATVLVGLAVFGAFAAVILRAVKNHREGKSGCSCGCGSCPGRDLCHPKEKK